MPGGLGLSDMERMIYAAAWGNAIALGHDAGFAMTYAHKAVARFRDPQVNGVRQDVERMHREARDVRG